MGDDEEKNLVLELETQSICFSITSEMNPIKLLTKSQSANIN